ncbi:MAG: hypothetical protein KYX62_09800 [Pseudomonadota bacterium]|nr:hypothetical protein [Pseudomonadota bacterium]
MRTSPGWLLLLFSITALALEPEPMLKGDSYLPFPDAQEDRGYSQETQVSPAMIDRSKDWLARYLDRVSGNIDSFFVDSFFSEEITEDDVRGSRAKLSFYTRRVLGDPVDYKFGLSVKVVLPNTNERLNLLLDSEEDDDDVRESDPIESVENVDYTAALRFIINETEQWKTNLDAGIRWGIPPDPFIRFRARRYAYLSDWEMRMTQSFYYYSVDGWGEETRLRMDYPLNIEKLFRVKAKAEYLLNDGYFDLSYSAGLYHELTRKTAMAYVAGASGDTENGATFGYYYAALRFRRLVYSDWVYAELSPEFIWDNDKDYETTPVIMFRIESVIAR